MLDPRQRPEFGATEVDLSHPLAQGCVAFWPFNEGAGSAVVNAMATHTPGYVDAAHSSRNPRGITMNTNATVTRSSLGSISAGAGNFTALVKLTLLRKTGAVDVCAIGAWNTGGTPSSNEWILITNYASTTTDYYPAFQHYQGSTLYSVSHTTQWAIGVPEVLVGVRRGTQMELWRNGILRATASCGSAAINNVSARRVRLGSLDGYLAGNTHAHYEHAGMWRRALLPAEIMQLQAEPFAMFVRKRRRTWFIPSAGPSFVPAPYFYHHLHTA